MNTEEPYDEELATLYRQRKHVDVNHLRVGQFVLEEHYRYGVIVWRVVKLGKRDVIGRLILGPTEWPDRYRQPRYVKERRSGEGGRYHYYESVPAVVDVVSKKLVDKVVARAKRHAPDMLRSR